MRLKKVSDLIHRSQHYPDLQYCAVTIHFADVIDKYDPLTGKNIRNEDGYSTVKGSELVIKRVADRSSATKILCE